MKKILIQIKEEENADDNEYNRTKVDKHAVVNVNGE